MTMPVFVDSTVVYASSFTSLTTGINALNQLATGSTPGVFGHSLAPPGQYVPVASAYVNTPISIPNATDTLVTFPNASVNNDNIWQPSAGELEPTRAGKYVVMAQINFAPAAGGVRAGHILLNGTSVPSNSVAAASQLANSLGQGNVFTIISPPMSLTILSLVYLAVYQNSGAALNLIPTLSSAFMTMYYVGQ